MLHDRGEERDVVANAFDGEGVERVGLRVNCLDARPGVRDELGSNHRIVIEGISPPSKTPESVAHRHPVSLAFLGRAIAHQPPDRIGRAKLR